MKSKFFLAYILISGHLMLSQTHWTWQNPYPQANKLNAVYCPGSSTVIAGGECGIFVKSSDSGNNWSLITDATENTINSIYFYDNQNGWAAGGDGINGVILKSTNGGINWTTVYSDTTRELKSIYFINAQTGWAAGGYVSSASMLKTTNGGLNWVTKQTGSNRVLTSVSFVTPLLGWASSEYLNVLKTTDGGESWTSSSIGTTGNFWRNIYFCSSDTGYVAGTGIYKTTNGGQNWIQKRTGSFFSLKFLNRQIGLAVGSSGSIAKTTDSGENWQTIIASGGDDLYSVSAFDSNGIYAVGWPGNFLKSTNAGNNWSSIVQGGMSTIESMCFADPQTGWVAGYDYYTNIGKLLKTTNSGTNWVLQYTQPIAFMSVSFINNSTGWMTAQLNTTGYVLNTTNGGDNWQIISSPTYIHIKDIVFVNSQTGYYIADGFYSGYGGIYKTTNSGNSWSVVGGATFSLYSIFFPSEQEGFVCGSDGAILRTTNYGNNWYYLYSGVGNGLLSIFFINEQTGWCCGQSRIIKTTDAGVTWSTTSGLLGSPNLYAVRFINPDTGWAAGGAIYKSTDGGNNWHPHSCITRNIIGSIVFVNEATGWIAGGHGTILKTTNCGGLVNTGNPQTIIPSRYYLYQNYPNPFNPVTQIKFDLPEPAFVKITIYDLLGREITKLVNQQMQAGRYNVKWDATVYPSGVYLYRLETDGISEVKKMVLIK